MTKEAAAENKTAVQKLNETSPNDQLNKLLKSQRKTEKRLKSDLKSLLNKVKISECEIEAKDKNIHELVQSINQRDAEIHTITNNLEKFKEDSNKILEEFHIFKEKFYQLETEYDRNVRLLKEENDIVMQDLQKVQSTENQEIQKLSINCKELQRKLQENIDNFKELNKLNLETKQDFEQLKKDYQQIQHDFVLYKQQAKEEKDQEDQRKKLDFDKLKEELKQKDNLIKQCISDKNVLETEKNLIIDELKNKIHRIEKAFSQPTKAVQPMVTLYQPVDDIDNSASSDYSQQNVGLSNPQVRKPLKNISLKTLSNNENQNNEQNQQKCNYKFKRPLQQSDVDLQSNLESKSNSVKKRRNQPVRSATMKIYNEFSSSSSDGDDKESNYNSFSNQLWRPNNDCYVADTDVSEGFAKIKRTKK